MKMGLFAMRDVKAGAFMQPVCFPTEPLALRWFVDLLRDPESIFAKHPEDFTLFYLGDLDTESGEVLSRNGGPRLINQLVELLGPKGVE